MPNEPDKPIGASPEGRDPSAATNEVVDEEENERPTVSPPFDPVVFARDILKPSPAPMRALGNADAHTHATPATGTPQATPHRPQPSRKTPTSTLSLINTRIPSNLPPRPTAKPKHPLPPKGVLPRREDSVPPPASGRESSPVDSTTRPPPADTTQDEPLLEIEHVRPPELDLDLEEEPMRLEARPQQRDESAPSTASHESAKPRSQEMNDRVELGDYSGALEIAEEILRTSPDDVGARAVAETCRSVLRQMYATRIGPLDRVPMVMVPRDQLRWLSIDHKAGFVLSLVDGVSSIEMIIDVSGMPELDTLRILSELAQQRIISLR